MDALQVAYERLYSELTEILRDNAKYCVIMTKESKAEMLNKVREHKNKQTGKTPRDYKALKSYDTLNVGSCEDRSSIKY
jgi:hypothetical protein